MYPIMRKNVIRRWTTLSLIDKGESSAEMIQMAHMQSSAAAGKGEKKNKKKTVSAICSRQHSENKTPPVPLLTFTTGRWLDA